MSLPNNTENMPAVSTIPIYANRIVYDSGGNALARFTPCMGIKCVYCKRALTDDDSLFFALDFPYCGVMHNTCVPFFNFNGQYPHDHPICVYAENSKIPPRT